MLKSVEITSECSSSSSDWFKCENGNLIHCKPPISSPHLTIDLKIFYGRILWWKKYFLYSHLDGLFFFFIFFPFSGSSASLYGDLFLLLFCLIHAVLILFLTALAFPKRKKIKARFININVGKNHRKKWN